MPPLPVRRSRRRQGAAVRAQRRRAWVRAYAVSAGLRRAL